MISVVVARSSSDDSAIRYVLPVLWMTPCLHTIGPMEQTQTRRCVSSSSPCGGTGGEAAVYDGWLVVDCASVVCCHPTRRKVQ